MSNTAPPPDSGVAKASTAESCSSKDVHLPRQAATDLPESDSGTPAAAAQAPGESDGSGLNRGLRNRHIQLIALGGAIGTGLFYGAADSIGAAGPAILVCYLIGGAVIYLIMRALGEMSVHRPTSGAFSEYAHDYWGELPGFVSGWNYWFPSVPSWLSAAVLLVVVTVINLLHVRAYGEFEFWFAIVKVVAIIAMVLLGAWVIVIGAPSAAPTGVANLWNDGGFFPTGISGVALGFVVVMFSFGGVELIGITAGEATDPRRSIPKAINQVVYRILLFYIAALLVIVSIVPWRSIDGRSSPFVQIFDSVGIPAAGTILNIVVLTAAVSAYNSGLYSNGRMLHSLAHQGNAPAVLGRTSRSGSPWVAVLVSSAMTALAVVLVAVLPDQAFGYIMSIALAAGIINWTMIVITQMRFRRRIDPRTRAGLTFTMPGAPVTNWIVLAMLAVTVVIMLTSPTYRIAIFVGVIWLAILIAAGRLTHRDADSHDTAGGQS